MNCTIRALTAAGIPDARAELEAAGTELGVPYNLPPAVDHVLVRRGWTMHREAFVPTATHGLKLSQLKLKGRVIVGIEGHLLCLEDGANISDEVLPSPDSPVLAYWTAP
jgi:hypothetical protein